MSDVPDRRVKKGIWDQLKNVALDDGVLSEEEQNLMANIIVDIEKYSKMMEKALEDGKIDERERRELFEGRMEILEKAYMTAREDKQVSEDEESLLKTICKLIIELNGSIHDFGK